MIDFNELMTRVESIIGKDEIPTINIRELKRETENGISFNFTNTSLIIQINANNDIIKVPVRNFESSEEIAEKAFKISERRACGKREFYQGAYADASDLNNYFSFNELCELISSERGY